MARRMKTLGLTGSIGMGKSTVSQQFAELGAVIYNADDSVHALLTKGGKAVEPVAAAFPSTMDNGAINRQKLGAEVFDNPERLKQLESILHPLVRQEEIRFLERCEERGVRIAVLDIPLLFETGEEKRFTATAVVWAPYFIQKRRVLARPGMTPERFAAILEKQMPSREKCARADYLIATGLGKAHSFRQAKAIMKELDA